jgi:type II secretory ATPase GspE/PulE/Tfp pilus assembly ATPase PilB-like protein
MGRVGIYEVLKMSDAIRMMLIKGTSTSELKTTALKEGMVTLLKDGMLKVKSNLTTPSEVLRNAYSAE